jgi:hypothetical protein
MSLKRSAHKAIPVILDTDSGGDIDDIWALWTQRLTKRSRLLYAIEQRLPL